MYGHLQRRRKDAAAKAEDLAEQQRLRLLEKERAAEANRLLVRPALSAHTSLRIDCICIWRLGSAAKRAPTPQAV